MQQQGKLYEEWLEVMNDYATVFSQDRGVPQNVDAAESSALVSITVLQFVIYCTSTQNLNFYSSHTQHSGIQRGYPSASLPREISSA